MESTIIQARVEQYIAMINQRAWDQIDALFTSDYRYHGARAGAAEPTPPAAVRRYFHYLTAAFPDLVMRADLIIVAGDYAVLRWVASGTHRGEYLGMPPSGLHGEQTGIAIWRVAGGRFVEGWQNQDDLGLVQAATAARVE